MKLIEFDGAGFGYPRQAPVLLDLNLSLAAGERILILGPNGGGKTTLGWLAGGLLQPSQGRVRRFTTSHPGMVFQNSRNQVVGASVEEELALGLTIQNLAPALIQSKVGWYLEEFQLANKRFHSPVQLSGGELRRLALAAVLITEPELLILDEPLAMLDQASRESFLDYYQRLIPEATAVIWLDHDLRSSRYFSLHYLLDQGRLQPVTPAQLDSAAFLNRHGLTPAPLQPLQWRAAGRISQAIGGPEAIEFN